MELEAVQLRDELQLRPVQVDLVTLDDAVGDRLPQAVLAQECAEVPLEARAGRRCGLEQSAEPAGRPCLQILDAHQPPDHRLSERGVEVIEGEVARDVEECAKRRGDRDPPVDGDVLGRQVARAVNDVPGRAA